jgi:hypothetical protein
LTKAGLGFTLGGSFKNASGHAGARPLESNICQGDQIWRIFAHWAIVIFVYFLNTKVIKTFIHGKSYKLILTKNGLGHILDDFFTNSSGHPDS